MRVMLPNLNASARTVLGVLAFKLNWLVLVVGQERWLGWAVMLLTVQLCFSLPRGRKRALRCLAAMLAFAACGIAVDSALQLAGVLEFADRGMPAWLCLLWCAFAIVVASLQSAMRRAKPVSGRSRSVATAATMRAVIGASAARQ